jgi:ribosome-binding factor A
MAGKQRSGRSSSRSSTPKYPRGARVGATLREIIADELVRIDDERLSLVSITGIDVDPELNRAIVFFDSLDGEEGDEAILAALGDHRVRLQSAIAKQIRAKKTPILDFRPDLVIRSAERIDAILRSDRDRLERQEAGVLDPETATVAERGLDEREDH